MVLQALQPVADAQIPAAVRLDGAAQIYRQALDPLLADLRDAAGQAA